MILNIPQHTYNRLFGLENKRTLADILDVPYKTLLQFLKDKDRHYNTFSQTKNGKSRLIQAPQGELKKAHKRLQRALRHFPFPDYVHSGRKLRSYKSNAKAHLGRKHALTMDIADFYPSCKAKIVRIFFLTHFRMSSDVAAFLADLVTIKNPGSPTQSIPTGSPASQVIAYLACKDVFDDIYQFALERGCVFTLYVDDMSFSSDTPIPHWFVPEFERRLKRVGLRQKRKKLRRYANSKEVEITGALLRSDGKVSAKNKLKREIFKTLKMTKIRDLDERTARQLYGKVNSAKFLEPDSFGNLACELKRAVQKYPAPMRLNRQACQLKRTTYQH